MVSLIKARESDVERKREIGAGKEGRRERSCEKQRGKRQIKAEDEADRSAQDSLLELAASARQLQHLWYYEDD